MGTRRLLKVCHVNVRSLLADQRLLDLEIVCANYSVDVLCVTETWLFPSRVGSSSQLVQIPGFQPPFCCDRTGGCGGGVAVYVRTGLHVTSVAMPSDLEAVCVQLHLPQRKNVYIATFYRPPSGGLPLQQFVDRLDSF